MIFPKYTLHDKGVTMSYIQGLFSKSWKVFREKIPAFSTKPGLKNTGSGLAITGESDDLGPVVSNKGDEAGWHYTEGTQARKFGSWSQATPALWNKNSNKVSILLNKAQEIDPNYLPKSVSSSAGDSHEDVRVATISEDKTLVPGLIVTCLNHDSQEQIFFPIGGTTESSGA